MSEKSKQTKIGKYEILEKIGEGGFGIVYRGRDAMLEREVAIKVLKSDVASAPDFVERFRREARLAASLRHPNIVNVIEVGEQEGSYYLVMEYLAGQTLAKLLEEGKPLPLTRAVELLHPLADALDHAHSKGIIHRDVKPGNVILADDGKRPVLTDFGLVKSKLEEGMTTTGVVLGTPEYMSPEQIQGKELGPAADQYALGVIAYQMLTGRVPFKGTTPFEVQNGHVSQPPPDPRSLNPGLSADAAKILLRALEKDPAKRSPKCLDFVGELERIAGQLASQQSKQLLQEAIQQMQKMDFDGAITRLEQLQTIATPPEAVNLLPECRRRKELWNQAQELLKQQEQTGSRINQLVASEKWINLPARSIKGDALGSSTGKKPARRKTFAERLFYSILVLFTFVEVGLAIQLGINAPPYWIIRENCSYAYYYNFYYAVTPDVVAVLGGFVISYWVIWLISKLVAGIVQRVGDKSR